MPPARAHASTVRRGPAAREVGPRAAARPPASPAAPAARQGMRCPCAGDCPRCATASALGAVGPGRPLEPGLRLRAEASLGAGLAGVRVHTDPAAAELARARGARAFTAGPHVYFAAGQYAPHTREGERRVAHELAHVVQQRNGPADDAPGDRYRAAEREGDAAAAAFSAGGRARVAERTAGLVQRQDAPERLRRPLTSTPEFQLHLDPTLQPFGLSPEMRALMMRGYLRWWLGTTLTTGSAPANVPTGDAAAGPEGGEPAPPVPPADAYSPVDPEVLVPEADVGAVMAPYGARGVPLGARDPDAAMQIYRRNVWWVSMMPDLRAVAPSFVRPLIPGNWRASLAGTFTAATIDAQLRHQYPTPIELSDRAFERFTGASTTSFSATVYRW